MTTDDILSLAIVEYLGHGADAFPHAHAEAILGRNGGEELLARVRDVIGEMDGVRPDWTIMTLSEAGEYVEKEMRSRHPELSPEAVRALGWVYTFSNR
jgi:hypothetical protein